MKNQFYDGLCYSSICKANAFPLLLTALLLIGTTALRPALFAQDLLLLDFQFELTTSPSTNLLDGSFSINGTLSGPDWVNGTLPHPYLVECVTVGEGGWAPEFTGWSAGEALVFTFNTLGRSNLYLQLCERTLSPGVNDFGTLQLYGNDGSGWEQLWGVWEVTGDWNASWDIMPLPSKYENKAVVTIELRKANNPGSQSYGLRIDNFQVYTLSSLPVDLTSFGGYHEHGKNILNWCTASETNNYEFLVERSADGTHWQDLGTVSGQGTSLLAHDYIYADHTPLPITYYRLQQRDYDGHIGFSKVISLNIANVSPSVFFYPNPSSGLLHIQDNGIAPTWIKVYNLQGIVLIDKPLDGQAIDVSVLPSGVYNIAMTVGHSEVYQRLLKL